MAGKVQKEGIPAILFNAKATGAKSNAEFVAAVKAAFAEKIERNTAKGMAGRAIKIMVLGIPNVGKSTVINNICGSKRAKAEDRPGVTRGKQWISAGGLDILDTPGILWPRLEDKTAAEKLAVTGAIRDEILDSEELAVCLLNILRAPEYIKLLSARYCPKSFPKTHTIFFRSSAENADLSSQAARLIRNARRPYFSTNSEAARSAE